MRAVVLGSSRPAVIVLGTLLAEGIDIAAVGAHAGEAEAPVIESVLVDARARGIPTVEFGGAEARSQIRRLVEEHAPDVGFTVGFRFLLDAPTLRVPPLGWLNVHSSLLPAYRGRAPINWAILNGERELGATMHYLDDHVDTGDIVFQEGFELAADEDVGDALRHYEPIYARLAQRAATGLRSGSLPRRPVDATGSPVWPRRTPEDGRIDWRRPAEEVVRLVRAVAPPYPGAFTDVAGRRLVIERATLDASAGAREPGLVRGPATIDCSHGALEIVRSRLEGEPNVSLAELVGSRCG